MATARLCVQCSRPFTKTGRGRPPIRCEDCRNPRRPTVPAAEPEAEPEAPPAPVSYATNDDQVEAEAWRDQYEALLLEVAGVTLTPSARRLPWEPLA